MALHSVPRARRTSSPQHSGFALQSVVTPTYAIRNLGTNDRGAKITAEEIYNLRFDPAAGWLIIPVVSSATMIAIAVDGSPLEIVRCG